MVKKIINPLNLVMTVLMSLTNTSCMLDMVAQNATQASQNYQAWKLAKDDYWRFEDYTKEAKITALMDDINYYLETHKDDTPHQETLLYSYNLLRELLELPATTAIDRAWFYDQAYESDKISWIEEGQQRGFIPLIARILSHLTYCINNLDPAYPTRYWRDTLVTYNILRELLKRKTISSLLDLDMVWLHKIKKEVRFYRAMEDKDLEPPTLAQRALVKQAQTQLHVQQAIRPLSYNNEDDEGDYIPLPLDQPEEFAIAIHKNPDYNKQIAGLYHEIGHIIHEHHSTHYAINKGQKTFQEALQDPLLEASVTHIDRYLEIGKRAFDTSTSLGKHIMHLLAQHSTLWIPPHSKQKLQEALYTRSIEKAADLYQLEKLFEHGHLDAIVQNIAEWAQSEDIIATADNLSHPSELERALYMAGFLVEKGININRAFQLWMMKGTCTSIPQNTADLLFSLPRESDAARDVQYAYYDNKRESPQT